MKPVRILAALLFLFLASNGLCEGIWPVNGHTFSNVNALQKGREVVVSGRVSGGPSRNPLFARIYVQDDEGRNYQTHATVQNYRGQGELFEARFHTYHRAKWWRIVKIESN